MGAAQEKCRVRVGPWLKRRQTLDLVQANFSSGLGQIRVELDRDIVVMQKEATFLLPRKPMSDAFLKLTKIYRRHADIEIVSGLNSYHFQNWRDAPFTNYFKENK